MDEGFAVLGGVAVEKPCMLVQDAANPRMDLVVVLSRDASAQSATAAPQPPPGMSAAQFALVQRMLARQRGAQASNAPQGAPEPQRGPKVALTLYRMGDESSVVWTTPIAVDKLMDTAQSTELEHEDLSVQDLTWAPTGDRFAVLLTLRRSPAKPSSSADAIRVASFVKTYSVQDGALLSTIRVPNAATAALQDRMSLSWSPIELGAGPVVSPLEQLLRKCRPLPALPSEDSFASASAQGNLMPHQLRMMQMSGKTPPPAFTYPSTLALQGRGPLASIPTLPRTPAQLGLVDSNEPVRDDANAESFALTPSSMVVVTRHDAGEAALLLDATVHIGSVAFAHPHAVALAHDLSALYDLHIAPTDALVRIAHLPLAQPAAYGPECAVRRIARLSRTSHLLRFYLGYATDCAAALAQTYIREWRDKVTTEWNKLLADAETKFGADIAYELLCVLLTGRAGEAADHLLLASLTEGVLTRLEQSFQAAAYTIKRLLAYSAKPALERAVICAQDLLGLVRFFAPESSTQVETQLRALQTALSSVLELARLVDTEAVVAQEFFRWCRVERERQERIKQDQDEPRLAITYDVLTVARFVDRGFENPAITHILASTASSAVPVAESEQAPVSLKQVLAEAKAHLSAADAAPLPSVKQSRHESVSVLPALENVAASIGAVLAELLGASLGEVSIDSQPAVASDQSGELVTEPLCAVDSLVTPAAEPDSRTSVMTRTLSTPGETLVAVATHGPAITIYRFAHSPTPELETCAFPVPAIGAESVELADMAFFGPDELLLLANTPSASTLLSVATSGAARPLRVTRPEQHATRLAVNTSKQTVTLLADDGKRLTYLDLPPLSDAVPDSEDDMVQD